MQIKKDRNYKLLVQVCKNKGIPFSYEKLVLFLNKYIHEDEEDSVFGYTISDIDFQSLNIYRLIFAECLH